MTDQENVNWIENYGFIMIAFAHMSDWRLAEAQLQVINEKLSQARINRFNLLLNYCHKLYLFLAILHKN